MNFKSFLLAELNDELGSDLKITADLDGESRSQINMAFDSQLNSEFSSPESGVQMIRRVLGDFGLEFPALYDLNTEGDEIIFSIDDYYLYIIYSLTDNGLYDFFAELVDDDGLIEILSDEGDEEEE